MGAAAELKPKMTNPDDIDAQLTRSLGDAGRADSLTHAILSLIAHQNYDHAAKELELYIKEKKDYPQFESMAERHANHGKDLIHAIKTKRTMPGLESLSMAKRQEIYDQVLSHFNHLKNTLKQIETMEYGVRIEDLRSTVIVVRTATWCILALVGLSFVLEVYGGLYSTTGRVAMDIFDEGVDWMFDLLGL